MPYLTRTDVHACPFCQYSSVRTNLKRHLTSAGKKGPRCPGLNQVIPSDVWDNEIVTFYRDDAHVPDLSQFQKGKKSPGPQRKRKMSELQTSDRKKLYNLTKKC